MVVPFLSTLGWTEKCPKTFWIAATKELPGASTVSLRGSHTPDVGASKFVIC